MVVALVEAVMLSKNLFCFNGLLLQCECVKSQIRVCLPKWTVPIVLQDVTVIHQRCQDLAVSVRKQSMSSLTSLAMQNRQSSKMK